MFLRGNYLQEYSATYHGHDGMYILQGHSLMLHDDTDMWCGFSLVSVGPLHLWASRLAQQHATHSQVSAVHRGVVHPCRAPCPWRLNMLCPDRPALKRLYLKWLIRNPSCSTSSPSQPRVRRPRQEQPQPYHLGTGRGAPVGTDSETGIPLRPGKRRQFHQGWRTEQVHPCPLLAFVRHHTNTIPTCTDDRSAPSGTFCVVH